MDDRPICATIIRWDTMPGIGVDYEFENGDRKAHAICREDWPIIKRLEHEGRLTFVRPELRMPYFDLAHKL
jgi:hypothetical protein